MEIKLNHIYQGDCLAVLRELPAESVHCCVTSPPYWGLRDYGADGQLGLEKTPEEYIEKMVAVFREVRRVLRDDGTCWVNMGDSYASGKGTCYNPGGGEESLEAAKKASGAYQLDRGNKSTLEASGLKPKDLCGIPWRLALALQADGWYLRSDIIWAKPNPMPESVTDRPTKAHEYLFLLTKKARYYYDADAVRERDHPDGRKQTVRRQTDRFDAIGNAFQDGEHERWSGSRNRRSVWTIPTAPFPQAHFATFPPKLVEPCIKAGTSEWGCCPECGAGWVRVVEKDRTFESGSGKSGNPISGKQPPVQGAGYGDIRLGPTITAKTLGWKPACECGHEERVPCVVLDPFMGAGTTGLVAKNLGRKYVGVELNPDYIKIANNRLRQEVLL